MRKYLSSSPGETREIGAGLGRLLVGGDVVALYGDLGAGKTEMVKGIARMCGIDERDIVSASFTIISEYHTVPPFVHVDLYRVEKAEDSSELGLWEYLGGEGITVIEWAEKADEGLPDNTIKVRLRLIDENTREIEIEGIDEEGRHNLQGRDI